MMVCMEHSAVEVDPVDIHPVDINRGAAPPPATTVAAVLAVKNLHRAKSRLAATLSTASEGDDPTTRGSLVLAMFLDTVAALRGAGVTRIVVVSPDVEVLATARRSGIHGLPETPVGSSTTSGLNGAFGYGARWAHETWPESTDLLFVQADLPAATSGSLIEVLRETPKHRSGFVTDRDGTGTVLLHGSLLHGSPLHGSADPQGSTVPDWTPRFGPDSAAAHRAAGAVELDPGRRRWADLRTDVDTATDLAAARELGLGAHTVEALRHL